MKRTYAALAATALLGLGGAMFTAAPAKAAVNHGPGKDTASALTTVVESTGQGFIADGDGAAKANSTAQFTVGAGALQLMAVPDLNFGEVPMETLLYGGTQKLVNNDVATAGVVSKNGTAFDGNADGNLIVNDLRGATAGWKLTAQLGPSFTSMTDGADPITGTTMALTATGTNKVNTTLNPAINAPTIGTTAATLYTAAATEGKGETKWVINTPASASLEFKATTGKVPNGAVYQSDIIWTLTAGAV
ncbi:WxL domain-containing protein [Schleiferilactobacillus shenzhenensis]|uniref:WxL domain-containing protein n=1 Tax=Schleiferilactobacillus shenzhenensis LY-73 TaxID=1231336 RepID=U4TSJ3_9LACO|nr:WxL domain-containing protein [Schleiferilactobacillus shenzhenensis]ERL64833.1 hypothetical protein L248_0610 [Schleiferilactobacillus shenzhenensis LY-73]